MDSYLSSFQLQGQTIKVQLNDSSSHEASVQLLDKFVSHSNGVLVVTSEEPWDGQPAAESLLQQVEFQCLWAVQSSLSPSATKLLLCNCPPLKHHTPFVQQLQQMAAKYGFMFMAADLS